MEPVHHRHRREVVELLRLRAAHEHRLDVTDDLDVLVGRVVEVELEAVLVAADRPRAVGPGDVVVEAAENAGAEGQLVRGEETLRLGRGRRRRQGADRIGRSPVEFIAAIAEDIVEAVDRTIPLVCRDPLLSRRSLGTVPGRLGLLGAEDIVHRQLVQALLGRGLRLRSGLPRGGSRRRGADASLGDRRRRCVGGPNYGRPLVSARCGGGRRDAEAQ